VKKQSFQYIRVLNESVHGMYQTKKKKKKKKKSSPCIRIFFTQFPVHNVECSPRAMTVVPHYLWNKLFHGRL